MEGNIDVFEPRLNPDKVVQVTGSHKRLWVVGVPARRSGVPFMGRVLVITDSSRITHATLPFVLGYCTRCPNYDKIIRLGGYMCLGRQGSTPDTNSLHVDVQAICELPDATIDGEDLVLPDGHPLAEMAATARERKRLLSERFQRQP